MKKELIDLGLYSEKIQKTFEIIQKIPVGSAARQKLENSYSYFKHCVEEINHAFDINSLITTKKMNSLLKYFRLELKDFSKLAGLHGCQDNANMFYSILTEIISVALREMPPVLVSKVSEQINNSDDSWKYYKSKLEQKLLEGVDIKCQDAFSRLLREIKKTVREKYTLNCPETVGVMYSWPKVGSKEYEAEKGLQSFLSCFKKHIEACGVADFIFDIESNPPGNHIGELRDEIIYADKVIAVGTESFKQRIENVMGPLAREYKPLVERHNKVRNHKKDDAWTEKYPPDRNFVLPMLFSGSFETSFPYGDFDYKVTVKPIIGTFSYYLHLKKWINDIFNLQHGELNELFLEFEKEIRKTLSPDEWRQIMIGMSEADVLAELATLKASNSVSNASVNLKKQDRLIDVAQGLAENPTLFFTDPGIDDIVMLAQALSSKGFNNIVGIVASSGNVPLESIKINILGMLTLTERTEIQVYEGALTPMTANHHFVNDTAVHGPLGLGHKMTKPLASITEEDLLTILKLDDLVATIIATPKPITFISTAGLTDVYYVLKKLDAVGAMEKVAAISMMGGVFDPLQSNAPKTREQRYGEFNFCCDPDATQGVFELCEAHEIRVILAPLDITHRFNLYGKKQTQVMRKLDNNGNNPLANLVVELLDDVPEPYKLRFGRSVQPVHDLFASMCLLHPELFEVELVSVTCSGGQSTDPGKVEANSSAVNTFVCRLVGVNDEQAFYHHYLESLQSYAQPLQLQQKSSLSRTSPRMLSLSRSPLHVAQPTTIKEELRDRANGSVNMLMAYLKSILPKIRDASSGLPEGILHIQKILGQLTAYLNHSDHQYVSKILLQCRALISHKKNIAANYELDSIEELHCGDVIYRTEQFLNEFESISKRLTLSEAQLMSNRQQAQKLIDEQVEFQHQRISPLSNSLDKVRLYLSRNQRSKLTVYLFLPELTPGCQFSDARTISFIQQVQKDLESVGLQVIYKRSQLRAGDSIVAFNQKAQHASFVLLFCTPELSKLYHDEAWRIENTDLVNAIKKQQLDTKFKLNRVKPILISGYSFDLPEYLENVGVDNWVELGYVGGLKQFLTQICCNGSPDAEFESCWSDVRVFNNELN